MAEMQAKDPAMFALANGYLKLLNEETRVELEAMVGEAYDAFQRRDETAMMGILDRLPQPQKFLAKKAWKSALEKTSV
jgi:hypothetical protein